MKSTPSGRVTEKNFKKIKSLWRQGKNVWEISVLTGVSENNVKDIVNDQYKSEN